MNIGGPAIQLELPSSLTRALLDDKNRSRQFCEYVCLNDQIPESIRANLRHPTVSDMLHVLDIKAASYLKQSEAVVEQLRNLFEYCLEEHLLYPYEREMYFTQIAKLR